MIQKIIKPPPVLNDFQHALSDQCCGWSDSRLNLLPLDLWMALLGRG